MMFVTIGKSILLNYKSPTTRHWQVKVNQGCRLLGRGTMNEILPKLRTVWPPDLQGTETGYKTNSCEFNGSTIVQTLDDLHEHAWWTGLKIVVGGDQQSEFLVTLVDTDGVLSTLRVMSGEVQPFQWALPAHVATARSIRLHIVPVLPNLIPYVNVISYFHEMPPLDPATAIHFILDNYAIAFSHPGAVGSPPLIVPSMHRLYQ
jgi:hypothetical protein